MNGRNRARALAAARKRLNAIDAAIKAAKGDPRAIVWPKDERAIIMGEGAPPTRPEPPPRPLMMGRVKGLQIPFIGPQYPGWMWGRHYILDDIAVSMDGKKTFPKKPTPTQQWKIEEAQRVIAYYAARRKSDGHR